MGNDTATAKIAGLDSILDSVLDDLADLPEFKPYPVGVHKFKMKWEPKEINKKPCMELKLIGIETVELADAENDKPITPGQETSILFMFKNNDGSRNEISEGKFKNVLTVLRDKFFPGVDPATIKNSQVIEASNGCECQGLTKKRKNKQTEQENTDLDSFEVL